MEKAAAVRAAVTFYWAKAQGLLAGWKGKAIAALLVLAVVAGYAHHLGAAGKSDLKAQVEQLKKQLADAEAKPAPQLDNSATEQANRRADDLAAQLDQSRDAKAKLEKKVKDYETQLARRPAKRGAFTLSPADARSLSNIK